MRTEISDDDYIRVKEYLQASAYYLELAKVIICNATYSFEKEAELSKDFEKIIDLCKYLCYEGIGEC